MLRSGVMDYDEACFVHITPGATLQKKFVSCLAGGPNHGHSGGRKFPFFCFSFFVNKY